jgi:hypothetical protein
MSLFPGSLLFFFLMYGSLFYFACHVGLCKPFLGVQESVASPVPPLSVNTEILLHACL